MRHLCFDVVAVERIRPDSFDPHSWLEQWHSPEMVPSKSRLPIHYGYGQN
jgi:hypothetical protein